MIVIVAKAAGPVPKSSRSQSRSPPVAGPTMTQEPLVVVKPVIVKIEGTVSIMRTKAPPTGPTFRTSMVYVNVWPVTTGSAESTLVIVRSGAIGVSVGVAV